MSRLKVLLTNLTLAGRTGTELYIKDLSLALMKQGCLPFVYSPNLGDLAQQLKNEGVQVLDDLASLKTAPDIIHGHHVLETTAAVLHFNTVPAIFVCHDETAWHDSPPLLSRVRHYVAVDEGRRNRLLASGISESRISLIPNFVDTERFQPRSRLPSNPKTALVFSNYASEETHLAAIRAACERLQIEVDVVGRSSGRSCSSPEAMLANYDLVFATGRGALEAMATGCAVIACDAWGLGSIITMMNVEDLRRMNISRRTLKRPATENLIVGEIQKYDREEAMRLCRHIREVASLHKASGQLLDLYRDVINQHRAIEPITLSDAKYLAHLAKDVSSTFQAVTAELEVVRAQATLVHQEAEHLRREAHSMRQKAQEELLLSEAVNDELSRLRGSLTLQLREALLGLPVIGGIVARLGRIAACVTSRRKARNAKTTS